MVILSTLIGAKGVGKISKIALLVGGLAIGSILIAGKGKTLGESFSSGLTGIGTGGGSLLGNIGEGIGGFGTGFAQAFTAITSAIGGSARGVTEFVGGFRDFSSAHQRNIPTTYNMRTIQMIREGRLV